MVTTLNLLQGRHGEDKSVPGKADAPVTGVPETLTDPAVAEPTPQPKRILVTGAAGMLGSDMVAELQSRNWAVVAPTIKELDLTNQTHLERLRKRDFGNLDWIVNCAAYTAVDKAEEEFFEAHKVNAAAPGALAFICQGNDWRFLHVSTDFVFDGSAREPYTERNSPDPQCKYGVTKLMGEKNAIENCERTVIARTAWLYGPNGKSFPRTLIKAWLEGKDIKVVNDQMGSPTYTADLARVMADLVAKDVEGGVYHTAGPDAMTWYDLACLAIETYRDAVLGEPRPVMIAPVPTSAWPTPAKRPAYSVMSFEKTASLGIAPMRSTPSALLDFCRRLPKAL
ncbi:MAG TPA: dTDP-4-dehydrorhamnose reductase [Fimbriimonadaceae bacterium]|nr:dTDP-4-dehydrorhamnose reductase [Fimbriimonadaceae bacterium]